MPFLEEQFHLQMVEELLRGCLDERVLSDMIVFSSPIIQNLWDPQKIFCLDTITHIWSPGFGHPITQKTE